MAARNPTDFTRWHDFRDFVGTEPVLAAKLDTVLDDQEYILDSRSIAICDAFSPIGTNSGPYVELRRWKFVSQDMCDVSGISNDELRHEFYLRYWCGAGVTGANLKLESTNATTTKSTVKAVTSATPAWTTSGALDVSTNDVAETIKLSAQVTAGAGVVYVAGILLLSNET